MRLFKNINYKLDLGVIDRRGDFQTGLTVTYEIRKSSDNSLVSSGTMVEVGTSGVYQVSVIFTETGQFRVEYTTPISYENSMEVIFVEDILQRILGLSQENYRIFNPVYVTKNNQPCMTSATIKIYPTASDCDADTNKIAEYQVTAIFDNSARMTNYKVKKI